MQLDFLNNRKIFRDPKISMGRAKRGVDATEGTEGAISWGVWGRPPTGFRGSGPKNFEILVPLDGRKLLFQHAFNE